uniref:Uncharacterized protein n=1 Tax=Oryza nivara TaxID=4536 RepID=A0A0E0GXB9_ORYNI
MQRQSNGQANRVYNGELTSWANPARGDDDVGTSKKRKRVIAKGGKVRTRRATKDVVETGADDDDDGEREEVSDDDVGSRAILRAPFGRRLGLALALRSHALAAHCSAKQSAQVRLGGHRLPLRKTEEDLRHKEDERRVVTDALKKANAEIDHGCSSSTTSAPCGATCRRRRSACAASTHWSSSTRETTAWCSGSL